MSDRKQDVVPLRVAVKYCGGCNPEYDRSEAVSKLQKALSRKIRLVGPEEEPDWIIAVQGCATACADLGSLDESRILHVKAIHDLQPVIEKLKKALRTH